MIGETKEISNKSTPAVSGGSSGDSRGGSSRSYPKGKSTPGDSQAAPFNPQKVAATSKYTGGVGG